MPLAPVHPLPSPKAVYGLCERFGDQSRLAALKRLVVEEPASEGRGRALGRGKSAAPGVIAGSLAPVDDPPPPSASAAPSAPSAPSEKKVHGPLVLVQPQNNDRTTKPDPKSADYKEASEALQNQLKAFTALDVTALPPVIQRTLAWMVAQKDAACKKNAAIAPSAEMGSELRLLRFLIGQKWDPYKASEEYLKVCNERKKLGVDSMRNQMVAENEAFFNGSSDSLQQIYFHSQAKRSAALMPRLWVDTREEGNYMLLRDKANHLVIAEYAPDFDKVSELGPDNYNATELAFNELQVRPVDARSPPPPSFVPNQCPRPRPRPRPRPHSHPHPHPTLTLMCRASGARSRHALRARWHSSHGVQGAGHLRPGERARAIDDAKPVCWQGREGVQGDRRHDEDALPDSRLQVVYGQHRARRQGDGANGHRKLRRPLRVQDDRVRQRLC